MIYIPAGCTGDLQPLHVTVNQVYKVELTQHFTQWYAGEVKKGLREGNDVADIKVDLCLSVVKPIHAKWLMVRMLQSSISLTYN